MNEEDMKTIHLALPAKLVESWERVAIALDFILETYVQDLLSTLLEDKLKEMKKEFH